jgi:hypothetical protein
VMPLRMFGHLDQRHSGTLFVAAEDTMAEAAALWRVGPFYNMDLAIRPVGYGLGHFYQQGRGQSSCASVYQ